MINIIHYILIIMLIIQILVLLQMLYINHKRYQQDKKFWEELHEKEKRIYDDLKFTVDCMSEAQKEDTESEQVEDQKQETGGSLLGEGKTKDK